jgi:hypothetical protein
MLSTNYLTEEARLGAAYTTEQHLRRHGASLCDLLDALDDPSGFEALCDLHSAFSHPIPDTEAVEVALADILRILADQPLSSLDRIGYERGMPASDMTRWHGARISELLARFRHAQ